MTRWILVVLCACSGESGTPLDPDATASNVDASADANEGCPDDLFRTFAMPQLSSRSNVCVPSATCTFTRTNGCAAQFSCQYELAGTQTGDVTFQRDGATWTATFETSSRRHEWVYGAGMAYRIAGSLADHHICVFTDGATTPVFPTRGAGNCPDLTRTFKLRQITAHSCSSTLRCGVFQSATDSCLVDAFCTYPTGTTVDFDDVAVAAAGTTGAIIGDATRDPQYPERYELQLTGDFAAGVGAATNIRTDYYFNAPATPTCSWQPNGTF